MENTYGSVTPETIRELQGIVGEKHVIFDDAEKLTPYSFDILALLHQKGRLPDAVVKPETTGAGLRDHEAGQPRDDSGDAPGRRKRARRGSRADPRGHLALPGADESDPRDRPGGQGGRGGAGRRDQRALQSGRGGRSDVRRLPDEHRDQLHWRERGHQRRRGQGDPLRQHPAPRAGPGGRPRQRRGNRDRVAASGRAPGATIS